MKRFLVFVVIILLALLICTNGFLLATIPLKNVEGYSLASEKLKAEDYSLSPAAVFAAGLTESKESVSIRFLGSQEDVDYLVSALKISTIYTEELSGLKILYGYSARITGNAVTVNGKKVNIQIARRGGCITAGIPLISTGY